MFCFQKRGYLSGFLIYILFISIFSLNGCRVSLPDQVYLTESQNAAETASTPAVEETISTPTPLLPVTNTPTVQRIEETLNASPLPSSTEIVSVFNSYTYEIVNTYPHDSQAFTQGLFYLDGYLYESTGTYGQSSLRKTELETGDVLQLHSLTDTYFAEGLTYYENRIYQLTWQENTGFIYEKDSFTLLEEFTYPTEGWGLTTVDDLLVMSDGSNTLRFLDPYSLETVRQIDVLDKSGEALENINELEYISGLLYANIWKTDRILIIDPQNGELKGEIHLDGLIDHCQVDGEVNVLNGIAYDPNNDRLFVTGKLWPCLFEIRLVLEEE